ncbi:MAG: hypothetical protein J7K40_02705 [candidate division Zixibacteria bacterium]|nr:hypothetical protein [candidate division Zixibacteria bacterium]
MTVLKIDKKIIILIGMFFCFNIANVYSAPRWYELYKSGLDAVKNEDWNRAIEKFEQAVQIENIDTNKKRVGTMFIEYYPHREMGTCFYNLGDITRAREELSLSLKQSPSKKARRLMDLIDEGHPGAKTNPSYETDSDYRTQPADDKNETISPPSDKSQLFGDRLSIAILPFETKGIGAEFGDIDLFDKMITEFHHLNRFRVIERSQLESILKEQKLGLTGIIDQSTAIEVGKTAGVDVVVFGSITSDGRSVSVDARLVDTETAVIISSQDAYSKNLSLLSLSKMIGEVTRKLNMDMPILNGIVIQSELGSLLIDMGSGQGLKKGMKCHIYREGEPIIHPVSGDTLDIKKDKICEVQAIDVYDSYSKVKIIKNINGLPQVNDKVQTK